MRGRCGERRCRLRATNPNCNLHKQTRLEAKMALRSIRLTVGSQPKGQAVTWSYPSDDGKKYLIPTYNLNVSGRDDKGVTQVRDFEVIRFGVFRLYPPMLPSIVGLADRQTHIIK